MFQQHEEYKKFVFLHQKEKDPFRNAVYVEKDQNFLDMQYPLILSSQRGNYILYLMYNENNVQVHFCHVVVYVNFFLECRCS